jgi:uncharacterized protein YaiL (DUF2058 family)
MKSGQKVENHPLDLENMDTAGENFLNGNEIKSMRLYFKTQVNVHRGHLALSRSHISLGM